MNKKTKNNNNNNGLCTSTWGSPGWFFLHSVAAGYPVDPDEYDEIRGNTRGHTKRVYTSFFKNTGHVLPCRFCRESYFAFIAETPIEQYINSREALFEWLFIIHNKVNRKLGVQENTDLKSVVDKYERFRAACHHDDDEKQKGCTEPAKKNVKMKCRLIVEPVTNSTRHRRVVATILLVIVLMLVFRIAKRTRQR